MGRTYSVNGYINATLRRSSKTLLVEGITDKIALHRLALERFPTSDATITIDHAGMLDDPLVSGMGNKAKVLYIRATADALQASIPKLQSVLASLTDREWDGLSFNGLDLAKPWSPPAQGENLFITHGHSIENYNFDIECVSEYLKFAFPQNTSPALLGLLKDRFCSMLALAAAFSLVAKDCASLTRCCGLLTIVHVRFFNNRYYLDQSFVPASQARGVVNPAVLTADVNNAIDARWAWLSGSDEVRWLAHGHLGTEVLWACVGDCAKQSGVSAEAVEQIAHGHKNERQRFFVDWLSKTDAAKRVPLDVTVDWLHT